MSYCSSSPSSYVGAIVYQFTAPPPAPGERSFAPGQLFEHVRRAMRGNRSSAEVTTRSTHPVDPELSELRFADMKSANITISGEARSDIDVELVVRSNGFDDEEAERLAKETALKVDPRRQTNGIHRVSIPRQDRSASKLTIKVPQRLAIQLQGGGSELSINRVAAVELDGARGKLDVNDVAGLVSGGHRGGDVHVVNAGDAQAVVDRRRRRTSNGSVARRRSRCEAAS